MKTFRQFITEGRPQTDEERELERRQASISQLPKESRSGQWKIFADEHAQSRAYERHPDKSPEDWHDLHKKVVAGIITSDRKSNYKSSHFSKTHDTAYVAKVFPKEKLIKVVNVMPKGKYKTQREHDLEPLIVEGIIYEWFMID